jgi:hypothetical protein
MGAVRLFSVIAALALTPARAATVVPAQTQSDQDRVRAEIMPLFKGMEAAANVHDTDAHLAYYLRDPSLTFVANGTVIHGWDNLVAQQRKWWPGGKIAPTDEAHEPYRLIDGPVVQLLRPGLAMLTFVLEARRVYPDRVTQRPLAISQLWERRSKGWKIIYAHESAGAERALE